ncbi:MAG: hypothetical protein QM528_06230 [Phycisphaerales bacterium]|nr:hypothetical protein [Phycisphaerales bacterium]
MFKKNPFFIKLFNWEYWPFYVFYAPINFVLLWFCIRARSLFFYTIANPSIYSGGFMMEKKHDIYALIPKELYPITLYFTAFPQWDDVVNQINNSNLQYPLIIKPDIGLRGIGVKLIHDHAKLKSEILTYPVPFLIQSYIPYECEAGVFYVRMPNEAKGRITGVVWKEDLSVTGNGTSTVLQLLESNPRYVLQLKSLHQILTVAELHTIPALHEKKRLLPIGNHSRGCLFLDYSDRVTTAMQESIDQICQQIPHFYFGRLDIKCKSWDLLSQGKELSIIELNGSGSEPTHIYDPQHSIFFAWKEVIRHWSLLYKVCIQNHQKGYSFPKFKEGVKMYSDSFDYNKKIKKIPLN